MDLQEQLNHLQKELDDQYQLLNELKKEAKDEEQFEEGKWVHVKGEYTGTIYLFKINKIEDGCVYGTGFNGSIWDEIKLRLDLHNWREATENEVKQALDKEAKRRGLVKGVTIKTPKHGLEYNIESEHSKYYKSCDILYLDSKSVYDNGKWAEPIEQNKIYDYTVEHKGGKFYKIGCEESLERSFLEQLATLTKKHDIKIELEGNDVTDDIINLNI